MGTPTIRPRAHGADGMTVEAGRNLSSLVHASGHPDAGLPRHRGPGLWVGYLVLATALTCCYYMFPAYQSPVWTALGLSSVVATVVGVRRHRPRQPLAWYLLAAAELAFITGDTTYNILTDMLHQDNPFPSVADLFYLLTYPLFAAGIFLIIRARSSSRDLPSLIDAVIITTGLGLLSWVYLIVPNFQADGLDGLQRATSVAYPAGDVMILALLARLVAGGGLRFTAMRCLVTGAVGLMAADFAYGLVQLRGSWQIGGPVDLGWVIFYIGWGVAALHPSMGRLSDVAPLGSVAIGRARLALLASASLITPAVLLMESQTNQSTLGTTVAIFSAALFILVLARMWGILAAHQQSVGRERALRAASESLVIARGLPDIYRAALGSVTSLVGSERLHSASVYVDDPTGVHCVADIGVRLDPADVAALWDVAQAGGHLSSFGTISVNPLRYDGDDLGMLVTKGRSVLTVDQHDALATVASQVALAVVSATLVEELSQRKVQEQFRGMIQNASDVIVVVDESLRISYATPSLERELGHLVPDLVGTPLSNLLHPDESATANALVAGIGERSSQVPLRSDWRVRHADDRYLFFEVLTSTLTDDSGAISFVLTMRNVSERRALEQQLMHQAFHDALTGLPNRALFQDRVEHALTRAARTGTAIVLAMVDLDDFKVVNDTRGHAAGDALLLGVAQRLQRMLRASTTVARLGGDEFAILIEDVEDSARGLDLSERVMSPFRSPYAVDGEELLVSTSIGVVFSGGSDRDLSYTELLRCADLALYAAKEQGKGRVEVYRDELHTTMVNRLNLSAELTLAMETGQFELHYQPIVLIDTGEILGSEVLVRWRHPTRGQVMPGDFIGLSETTGQIIELGRWVLDRACAQWREWADLGHVSHRLSVNVSAHQLKDAGFADEVGAVLRRHRMPPGALVLELTESVFALDTSVILEQLSLLAASGVHIAVDDFGTGYSSLSYLQRFNVHELKVDKSFVDGLGTDNPDDGALTAAILSMAQSLRLEVVAEGIERVAQRDELWSLGCALGQGYLYSRPVPPDELLAMLACPRPLGPPLAVTGGPSVARLRMPTPIVSLPGVG